MNVPFLLINKHSFCAFSIGPINRPNVENASVILTAWSSNLSFRRIGTLPEISSSSRKKAREKSAKVCPVRPMSILNDYSRSNRGLMKTNEGKKPVDIATLLAYGSKWESWEKLTFFFALVPQFC